MKIKNLIFFVIIVILYGCKDKPIQNSSISTNDRPIRNEVDKIRLQKDASIVEHELANKLEIERNTKFQKMEIAELIDSLKVFSKRDTAKEIMQSEKLFGRYDMMGFYYENNLPFSVYKRIFPKVEDDEDTGFTSLYSVNEKDKYLQLIFAKEGKYNPQLVLINVDKKNLNITGRLDLYGGIYDSYDINYWTCEFMNNYEKISVTHVENQSFDAIDLDTTVTSYVLSSVGAIVQQ